MSVKSLRNLLVIPALLCATATFGQKPESVPAHADIVNAKGDKIGTAAFTPVKAGVRIVLNVTQLDPGTHGVHIHTVGKCEGPAFASAGGHFNPEMRMHGKDNPQGAHAGDLPNLVVGKNGKGHATILADHLSLDGGPNSLFHDGARRW